VIPEIGILLRIQNFQKSAGRIALETLAHLVDFVDHEYRVFSLCNFQTLDDLSRKGTNVGPAMAFYFSLVPHSAHGKTEKRLAKRTRDGAAY